MPVAGVDVDSLVTSLRFAACGECKLRPENHQQRGGQQVLEPSAQNEPGFRFLQGRADARGSIYGLVVPVGD
jgi:hypothetical protein